MVGIDSTLKLFYAYLKRYKLKFNPSFQHLKFVGLVAQNNFSKLFLHSFLITTVHFPQVLIQLWK